MPSVLKTRLQPGISDDLVFVEWSYGGWKPGKGQLVAWFTPESSGGVGLFALGRITSNAIEAGKNAKGNDLVRFSAMFDIFHPILPLCKEHFKSIPRIGAGSPIQHLNRCLYINSHLKVAEIDSQTFQFLADRF